MASDGLLSARTNPGRDLLAQRVVEISPAVRQRAKAPTADRNATRLWEAAEAGEVATLTALVDQGTDANAADTWGRTACHLAAAHGHEAAVTALGERGARADIADGLGRTAAHHAAQGGHTDIIRALYRIGGIACLDARDTDGCSPAHRAAAEGHGAVLAALSHFDASMVLTDNDGCTPAHRAAMAGHQELVRTLLDLGCDPAAVTNSCHTVMQWTEL